MRARLFLFSAAIFPALSHAAPAWPSAEGQGSCKVTKHENVPARMRDGTILKADVYQPDASSPVPVILMRTQYGKAAAQVQPSRFQSPAWFSSHCYIVVIQDIRGQGASGGTFYEYRYDRNDGYDSVQWAAHLPGSNGRVGMYGSSYVGATQWLAATATPPALKAIVPSNTSSDYYDGWTYEDGAFRLAFIEPWMMMDIASSSAENRGDKALSKSLYAAGRNSAAWMTKAPYAQLAPMRAGGAGTAPYFFDALSHPTRDAYWEAFQIRTHYDRVQVPVLAFDGWYDSFLAGAVENFNGMRTEGGTPEARTNQRLIIGPWEHIAWGRPNAIVSPMLKAIGPVANSPVNELMLAWFGHFLKDDDTGVLTGPRVDYFTMGENRWHHAAGFPVPGTTYQAWALDSQGHANSSMGDGLLSEPGAPTPSGAADTYDYDPHNPVPSLGGHSCCAWTMGPQGQFDQAPIEQRPDILVYTSAPLKAPLDVTGPITVVLYARSSAKDTDFTAKLVDVAPTGQAINLTNGIQRASYRESLSNPTPIVPGRVYRYTIHVWPTSNLFQEGHRIRLEISSSDYPQFDPNPNTGGRLATDAHTIVAHQAILHDAAHPSTLTLPVLDAQSAGAGEDHPPMH